MRNENTKYLCDGRRCRRMCAENGYDQCKHTANEKYAKNKIRRERKFEVHGKYYVEVER